MIKLSDNITALRGVGARRAEALGKAGIFTIYDLLTYFPRTYIDLSRGMSIRSAPFNENVCIKAFVGSAVREHYIRKGMTTYTADITDGESVMSVVFFNNKYITDMLVNGEEYCFYGKITSYGQRNKSMTSPKFFKVSDGIDFRPVYPQTSLLNSNYIEKLLKTAFDSIPEIEDYLPEKIRNDYCLMGLRDALVNIHFPSTPDLLSEAKRRVSFENLFLLQLGLSRLKIKSRKSTGTVITENYTGEFLHLLPYELTGAQKRAINDCVADMSSGLPMNRLLQG
ncbi:MAG: ATP-dependent DNA helicase RecG, partial [Clostridia bacterium]|nr:ATP-dependent DNA helicase RecG [Clostridia bacterium]